MDSALFAPSHDTPLTMHKNCAGSVLVSTRRPPSGALAVLFRSRLLALGGSSVSSV